MGLTTDPNDPRLTHYTGPEAPGPQAETYLVLSEEERSRGFVRPLRRSYLHVGIAGPRYPLRDLTDEEENFRASYAKYEKYPASEHALGRFWTQAQLDAIGKGCGALTRMGLELCETYSRSPNFYAATYCCRCQAHFPVNEFVWDEDGERVGS